MHHRTLRLLARDLYSVLGVSKDASGEDIKKAYRKKAALLHPDVSKRPNAAAEFTELNDAYETLRHPQKRSFYHATGSKPKSDDDVKGYEDFVKQQNRARMQEEAYRREQQRMEQMFGGGRMGPDPGSWRRFEHNPWGEEWAEGPFYAHPQDWNGSRGPWQERRGRDTPPRAPRNGKPPAKVGSDIALTVELSAEEALRGTSKMLSYQASRACWTCGGTGTSPELGPSSASTCSICGGMGRYVLQLTPEEVVQVECEGCGGTGVIKRPCPKCKGKGNVTVDASLTTGIPPGLDSTCTVRIQGQGHHGTNGGQAGDLVLKLKVSTFHKTFVRGSDGSVHLTVPIPLSLALLGGKTTVKALHDGDISVPVKPGTQHLSTVLLDVKGPYVYPKGYELRITPDQKPPQASGGTFAKVYGHFVVTFPEKLTQAQKDVIQSLSDNGPLAPRAKFLQQEALTFLRARHAPKPQSSGGGSQSSTHSRSSSSGGQRSGGKHRKR